jgi:1-acyl-sn-glycerol-3-phosphate acyltransferase
MMVMPHTSAHDFIWDFTRGITGLEMNWVGKKELFRFPFGFILDIWAVNHWIVLGFKQSRFYCSDFDRRNFSFGSCSEGTRKSYQLKTGFYYIALKANVPIIPVAFW